MTYMEYGRKSDNEQYPEFKTFKCFYSFIALFLFSTITKDKGPLFYTDVMALNGLCVQICL